MVQVAVCKDKKHFLTLESIFFFFLILYLYSSVFKKFVAFFTREKWIMFSEEHDVVEVDLSTVKTPSLKNAEVRNTGTLLLQTMFMFA